MGFPPKISLIGPSVEALTDIDQKYTDRAAPMMPQCLENLSQSRVLQKLPRALIKITTASGSLKPPSATFRRCQADTKCQSGVFVLLLLLLTLKENTQSSRQRKFQNKAATALTLQSSSRHSGCF